MLFNILQAVRGEAVSLVFTIPIFEPLPSQYYIRCSSDRWLGSDDTFPISFQHLILPERHPPHTGQSSQSVCFMYITEYKELINCLFGLLSPKYPLKSV